MAAPSINGTPILASLAYRGTYKADRFGTRRESGEGTVLTDEFVNVQWQFWSMSRTEFLWWNNTLMGGAAFLQIISAELWDDENTAQTYTAGTVYPIIPFKYESGRYWASSTKIEGLS